MSKHEFSWAKRIEHTQFHTTIVTALIWILTLQRHEMLSKKFAK